MESDVCRSGYARCVKSSTRKVRGGVWIQAWYVNGTVEVGTTGLEGELVGWSGQGEDVDSWLEAEAENMADELLGPDAPPHLLERARVAVCVVAREVYHRAREIERMGRLLRANPPAVVR